MIRSEFVLTGSKSVSTTEHINFTDANRSQFRIDPRNEDQVDSDDVCYVASQFSR